MLLSARVMSLFLMFSRRGARRAHVHVGKAVLLSQILDSASLLC